MGDDDKAEFVRELMVAVRSLPATGIPTWRADLNEHALRVRTRLVELSELLDTRSITNYEEHVVVFVEGLMKKLEDTMSKRRKSRVGGLAGDAMRIAGTLAYAHPMGKTAYWAGLAISTSCDLFAGWKGRECQSFSMEIELKIQQSRDLFRPVAGAIRRLDELLLEGVGGSIYDEEFQNFLRDAEVQAVNAVPCKVDNVEHRNNLIELVRNKDLLQLLKGIATAISNEDVLFFTVVSYGLLGISLFETSVSNSAALQAGELCSRGFALFFEYKHDKITLQHYGNELERMKKQLKAMKEVEPYLI